MKESAMENRATRPEVALQGRNHFAELLRLEREKGRNDKNT